MATRRNRIKGIANIPQRRKTENKEEVKIDNIICTLQTDTTSGTNSSEIISKEVQSSVNVENDKEIPNANVSQVTEQNDDAITSSISDPTSLPDIVAIAHKQHSTVEPVIITSHTDSETISLNIQNIPKSSNNYLDNSLTIPPSQNNQRRTFIKPKINVKSLAHKLKPKLSKIELSSDLKDLPQDTDTVCSSQLDIQTLPITPESETITEPPSPTKQLNRSRIKAVPRLHQRRISATIHGSASESEDDTRKSHKRVKTDSICSTSSSTCETPTKNPRDPPQPQSKILNPVVQRKFKRSEQSSKMAEARRNFQTKFQNQIPEKQKLTMYDLIFYNPATKPMTQKQQQQSDKTTDDERLTSLSNCNSPERDVDSDDNNVPAPQIKIGKNGEIIIDEKSLIVENKETKKNRENLNKSQLVNGDFDTGYGVYKKIKRSKDWNKEETLFFYKALHTLGTDFSLMVQLFPGRTRRELKMKFKKEDRTNHALVDKALSQPLQFNIKELKQEVEHKKKMKELEEQQKQKRAQELEDQNKKTAIPYSYYRLKRTKEKRQKKVVQKSDSEEDIYSKLEMGIGSVCNSDNDETDSNDSSCEITVSNILKQTRYGRIPNKKKIAQDSTESLITPSEELEPGSVMITCEPTSKGEPTFKVFMVTPTHTKVPIDFPSDVINTFTKTIAANEKPDDNSENVIENNYTICHDEDNETRTTSSECGETT